MKTFSTIPNPYANPVAFNNACYVAQLRSQGYMAGDGFYLIRHRRLPSSLPGSTPEPVDYVGALLAQTERAIREGR